MATAILKGDSVVFSNATGQVVGKVHSDGLLGVSIEEDLQCQTLCIGSGAKVNEITTTIATSSDLKIPTEKAVQSYISEQPAPPVAVPLVLESPSSNYQLQLKKTGVTGSGTIGMSTNGNLTISAPIRVSIDPTAILEVLSTSQYSALSVQGGASIVGALSASAVSTTNGSLIARGPTPQLILYNGSASNIFCRTTVQDTGASTIEATADGGATWAPILLRNLQFSAYKTISLLGAARPNPTNAAVFSAKGIYAYYRFPTGATSGLSSSLVMPLDWKEGTEIEVYIICQFAGGPTSSQNCYMTLSTNRAAVGAKIIDTGESVGSATIAVDLNNYNSYNGPTLIYTTPFMNTITTPQPVLQFTLSRGGLSANDTCTYDMYLTDWVIKYQSNKPGIYLP